MSEPEFTPVFLLTGFLGSGKTTLLGRLIADPSLSDTAVLINEFGEVALDHHLLERVDDATVVLKSGCVCCTVKGELAAAVRDLYSRRARGLVPNFRRLVIETTGLADPAPIISTFSADPVIRHHFRVASVIVTLDAMQGAKTLEHQAESVRQVAMADRLVLTKSDIADPSSRGATIRAARTISPDAALFDANELMDDLATILDQRSDTHRSGFSCEPIAGIAEGSHLASIRSTSVSIDGKVDWATFGIWLTMTLHRHADDILRVKAILHVEGAAGAVAVHGVQNIVHAPRHMPDDLEGLGPSRAVFIHRGDMGGSIIRSLNAFGISAARWQAELHAA